ncbi:MAG: hypothetical protein AAFP02_07265 [Bacteroidota bacterium]
MQHRLIQIVCLLFLLVLGQICLGQSARGEEDVLYLHNGSVIRGQIIEQVPGEYIRIELASGQILTFRNADIEKITVEPPLYSKVELEKFRHLVPISYRTPGIYHQFDWGLNFTQGEWGPVPATAVHYRMLYHQNKWFNFGLGTGIEAYGEGVFTPLFAELQGDLYERRITPTYLLQAGYGFATSMSPDHEVLEGGLMGQAALGFKINTRSRTDVSFTIGYKFQDSYQEFREWPRNFWNVPPGTVVEPYLVVGSRFYQRVHYQISFSF